MQMTITNRETGRKNNVRVWDVDVAAMRAAMLAAYRAGTPMSSRDVGWWIINHDQDVAGEVEDTLHEEDARSNVALNIFENALDWGLGLAICHFIDAYKAHHRNGNIPRRVRLGTNRKGDVFVITPNGVATKWA